MGPIYFFFSVDRPNYGLRKCHLILFSFSFFLHISFIPSEFCAFPYSVLPRNDPLWNYFPVSPSIVFICDSLSPGSFFRELCVSSAECFVQYVFIHIRSFKHPFIKPLPCLPDCCFQFFYPFVYLFVWSQYVASLY